MTVGDRTRSTPCGASVSSNAVEGCAAYFTRRRSINALRASHYALLLMMSTYGMGAGGVIRLTVDDLDWGAQTMHVIRPKTGVEFSLVAARSCSRELRLSVSWKTHARSDTSPAYHSRAAVQDAQRLERNPRHSPPPRAARGRHCSVHGHALFAARSCVPTNGIGDGAEADWRYPGHRDPQSTSAYLRVTTERLRDMALAVPR